MKPVRDSVEVLERGTKIRTKKMSVDENSLEFIMHVLTTLYSDPAKAVIREYATNAWDSHLAAGNTDPILVTSPDRWTKKFSVQDYGVGLSIDDLYDIYSKYGASTKRDSDVEAGMLGLGAKSGLAYADSFSLYCVKDGKFTDAIVARDAETGTADMIVTNHGDTDEPNGVLFSIAVRNVTEFKSTMEDVFQFWKHGNVLVDGEPPVLVDGENVGHNCVMRMGDNRWGQYKDYVVMGNVAYPTDFGLKSIVSTNREIVHYAPMGAVEPTPSREELKQSSHTKAYIEQISHKLQADIIANVQAEVSKADNIIDAMEKTKSLRSTGSITWRGYQFSDLKCPTHYRLFAIRGYNDIVSVYDNSYASKQSFFGYGRGHDSTRTVIVTNYTNSKFTKSHALKINAAADHDYKTYIVIGDGTVPDILDGLDVVDWPDAKYIKLEAATYGKSITAGRYYVYDRLKRSYSLQDTYKHHKYIYYSTTSNKYSHPDVLLQLFPDRIPVKMTANRFAKFKREHDDAVHSSDAVDALRDKNETRLTHADKLYICGQTSVIGDDPSVILDPDVIAYVNEFKGWDKQRCEQVQSLMKMGVLFGFVNRYNNKFPQPRYDVEKNYPLIRNVGLGRLTDKIEYVNAVYLYRKGN